MYTTFMGMKYLPIEVVLVVRLKFSQWCCWRFKTSGIWHHVSGCVLYTHNNTASYPSKTWILLYSV